MSIKKITLDRLSKRIKNKFKNKYKLSSLDYVLGKEVKKESTITPLKPVVPTSLLDNITAVQVIKNGQPV